MTKFPPSYAPIEDEAQKQIAEANAKAAAAEAKAKATEVSLLATTAKAALTAAAILRAGGTDPSAMTEIIVDKLLKNKVTMNSHGSVFVEIDSKKLTPAEAVATLEANPALAALFKTSNGRQVKTGSVKNVPVAPTVGEVDVTKLTWDQFKKMVKENTTVRLGIKK